MKTDPVLDLEVRLHGQRVGRLERTRSTAVRFVPDGAWIAQDQLPRLGLRFRRNPHDCTGAGSVPKWFENLLPERDSALRTRLCAHFGLRAGQSAGLLGALGRVLPGAVEVVGTVDGLADRSVGGPPVAGLKVSLAGMQIKLSMVLSNGRLVVPARSEDGLWIVKFPGAVFEQLPEVEAATMAWAHHLGHEVPEFLVSPLESLVGVPADLREGPPTVYAIRRFDRVEDGGRIHQEDFAQALDIEPKAKYGDGLQFQPSYADLGRLVLDACGPAGADEYVRRLAFVLAAGNGDAHLKNWSFQWPREARRPRLSPCYDLVSDISWPTICGWQAEHPPTFALRLFRARAGGTRPFADVTARAVRLFQDHCGIPHAESIFVDALRRAGQACSDIGGTFPERMRTALVDHWSRVPLLRSLGPLRVGV